MKIVQVPCRLCGSDRYDVIAREIIMNVEYTIAQCKNCALVYTRDSIAEVSPEYVGLTEEDLTEEHIWRQGKHKEPAFRQCLRLIDSTYHMNETNNSLPTLLDVGCGVGNWLQFVNTRFQCYGFDASPIQVAYAQDNIPNVRRADSLDEYRRTMDGVLPPFNLITLWDVLEHIRHPTEFLQGLIEGLSEQGLFFASVPAATPMLIKQKLLHIGWPNSRFSWAAKEHVVYYTPKTLGMLIEKVGLRIIKIGSVVCYPRELSVFEVIRRATFQATYLIPQIAPQIYVLATIENVH